MAELEGPRSRAPLRGSNGRWGEVSDLGSACPLLPVGESSLQRRLNFPGSVFQPVWNSGFAFGGAAGSLCDRVGLPGGTVETCGNAEGHLPANAGI